MAWSVVGTDSDPDADLTGIGLECQIRAGDSFVATLACSVPVVVDNSASANVTHPAATQAAWPLGDAVCDLKWILNGVIWRSETFTVSIVAQVTA